MFLRKQHFILFAFGLCWSNYFLAETLQLMRVAIPTKHQIGQEKQSLHQREYKRFVVKIGTTASVLAVMYITYSASEYFKNMDKRLERVDQRISGLEQDSTSSKNASTSSGIEKQISNKYRLDLANFSVFTPAKWIAGGTKSLVKDVSKCIIQSCPTFISGMLLSTFWQQVCKRVIEASKQETLLWYIENHTKVWPLFHSISLTIIPYDLHSELLSLQQTQDKGGICIRSYVDELSALLHDGKDSSASRSYFDCSYDALKKNYEKKENELTLLQNYAAPNIAKRKRAMNQGFEDVSLFQDDQAGKQNIVDLINVFVEEIQKVINFSMMHIENSRSHASKESIARGEKRIAQMIQSANRYLDHMELLLSMNYADMESMSIANKGMFTITYEFERLFREQVDILHRYCSFIG